MSLMKKIINCEVIDTEPGWRGHAMQWNLPLMRPLKHPQVRTPRYSVKRTGFSVPLVPGLYKIHSIMRTLAGLSHKIVRNWTL